MDRGCTADESRPGNAFVFHFSLGGALADTGLSSLLRHSNTPHYHSSYCDRLSEAPAAGRYYRRSDRFYYLFLIAPIPGAGVPSESFFVAKRSAEQNSLHHAPATAESGTADSCLPISVCDVLHSLSEHTGSGLAKLLKIYMIRRISAERGLQIMIYSELSKEGNLTREPDVPPERLAGSCSASQTRWLVL